MVLSAIRRGEDSLPKLRTATGMEYAKLEPVLYKLEFEWRSIRRTETPDGFARFTPAATEKTTPFKGTDWREATPITPQAFRTTRSSIHAQELALLQRDAPFCVGCHGLCILHGTDRNERVRWRCKPCGLSFVGSGCPGNPIVNQIREEKREQAISAFNEAKSVRQVAAEVGISKGTAQKIRAEENIEVLCPCGKDAKHQGWCAHRYAQSPERQAVIAKMHMAHIDPHEQAEQEIAAIVERGSARREQLGDEEEKFLNEMRGGELSEEEARIAEEIDSELAEPEHFEVFDARNEVCGCGRQLPHGGRCSARRTPGQKSASKEIAEMLAESRENITETITTELCWCSRPIRHRGHHIGAQAAKPAKTASNGHNADNAPIADIARNPVSTEKPKQAMAKSQNIIQGLFQAIIEKEDQIAVLGEDIAALKRVVEILR